MSREKKPADGLLFQSITNRMNGLPANWLGEGFVWPHKLMLVKEQSSGVYTIILVKENKVCEIVSIEWVEQQLHKALSPFMYNESYFSFDSKKISACARFWYNQTSTNSNFVLQNHPKATVFKSEDVYCYSRLDFDVPEYSSDNKFFIWQDVLKRMTNSDAFCMFVWSLFEEKSDRTQYLYIYGEGGSGKSSIGDWLERLLGESFTSSYSDQISSPHWAETILGKRLCFVTESSSSFPKSARFKGMTGDKSILINPKGKRAYRADHQCKFYFASNDQLELDSKRENIRRAIYCELGNITNHQFSSQDWLHYAWMDTPNFLSYCRKLYQETVHSNSKIPVDVASYAEVIEETEIVYNAFIEKWFVFDENSTILSSSIQKIFACERTKKHQKTEIFKILKQKHGVYLSTIRREKDLIKVYRKIGLTDFGKSQLKTLDNLSIFDSQ